MPSDHDVWKAIEEYIKTKSSSMNYQVEAINSLTYSKIAESVIKNTRCDKAKVDDIFSKMEKEGEIKAQQNEIKIYLPKNTSIKFGKQENDKGLQWFIGLYSMLTIASVVTPTTNLLQAIGLLVLGSFTMFVGNKLLVLITKINQYARKFGERYYLPISIINWMVFFLILFSSTYFIFSILFLQQVEINSDRIFQAITAATVAALSLVGLQRYFGKKETSLINID